MISSISFFLSLSLAAPRAQYQPASRSARGKSEEKRARCRASAQVREVVDTENIPKGFFIGQPTRKGTYGMPGCTFGEQFGGASGDVFK